MERGRIVKALSGFYYVDSGNGTLTQCRARGRFRRQDQSPLVGDFVRITRQPDAHISWDVAPQFGQHGFKGRLGKGCSGCRFCGRRYNTLQRCTLDVFRAAGRILLRFLRGKPGNHNP